MKKLIILVFTFIGLMSCEKDIQIDYEGTYEGTWYEFDVRGGADTTFNAVITLEPSGITNEGYIMNTPRGSYRVEIAPNGNIKSYLNLKHIGYTNNITIEFASRFTDTYIISEFTGIKK